MPLPPTITDNTVTLTYTWATNHQYYGYCTISDVLFEFQDSGNMTDVLTNSVVAQCITQAGVEMQNQLDNVYQMPYVGADLGIKAALSDMNAKLAASLLYTRMYGANEPDMSKLGAELRSQAELRILGIIHGEEQWASPQGDAIARGDKPVYPKSARIASLPDTSTSDPATMFPFFTMGASGQRYNKPSF